MLSNNIMTIMTDSALDMLEEMYVRLINIDDLPYLNGTGGADAWYNFLIPKTIDDVDITAASINHDWRFHMGATLADYFKANRLYLNDILTLIDNDAIINERSLEDVQKSHKGAWLYYLAVDKYGLRFFKMEKDNSFLNEELSRMGKELEDEIDARKKMGEGDMY